MANPNLSEKGCPEDQKIIIVPTDYPDQDDEKVVQTLQRAQWVRAAILGANDGLLSTTSLMLGIGAAQEDRRSMVVAGIAGAIAGACSMAVGEFVSVSTQRDIEKAALKRSGSSTSKDGAQDHKGGGGSDDVDKNEEEATTLTNPYKAAAASALAFLCGAVVPLIFAIAIAGNIARIVAVAVAASIAMVLFGGFGAYLGGSPIKVSAARVLVGGWIAMAISYGLLKPFDDDDNALVHHSRSNDGD